VHYSNFLHTSIIPIPPSDALPTLRNYIHTKWQATWGSFSNNKIYKIFPKLQHPPPLHHSYSRKEQVILNRLLIGHTHLTHSYLLNKEQPPNCNYCKSLLTVEHILTSCSAYRNIRENHYSNSQLPHILTNISKQHIFNYLSEKNFLKQTLTFSMARYGLSVLKVPLNPNQPTTSNDPR